LGAGLTYAQIVRVLHALTKDQTIASTLELERATVADLLGPEQPRERPEGDNDPLLPDVTNPPLEPEESTGGGS
jgi:hypothetical protein